MVEQQVPVIPLPITMNGNRDFNFEIYIGKDFEEKDCVHKLRKSKWFSEARRGEPTIYLVPTAYEIL